ncbi:MAG: hypothetical protein ACQXXJ_06580 [Candidatus Bathyarchaeia archaeon]|jgi:hypothetical protein
MQTLGLVLALINILAIAAPVATAVIVYSDNLPALIIPPEVNQLVEETAELGPQIQLPQLVNYTYDQTAKTVTVIFNFTNPLNLNVTVNALAANVVCNDHNFYLGHVGTSSPVELNKDTPAYITAAFSWTTEAENHFLTDHANEDNISISLEDIVVDISGITVEAPSRYNIGNIPIPRV